MITDGNKSASSSYFESCSPLVNWPCFHTLMHFTGVSPFYAPAPCLSLRRTIFRCKKHHIILLCRHISFRCPSLLPPRQTNNRRPSHHWPEGKQGQRNKKSSAALVIAVASLVAVASFCSELLRPSSPDLKQRQTLVFLTRLALVSLTPTGVSITDPDWS